MVESFQKTEQKDEQKDNRRGKLGVRRGKINHLSANSKKCSRKKSRVQWGALREEWLSNKQFKKTSQTIRHKFPLKAQNKDEIWCPPGTRNAMAQGRKNKPHKLPEGLQARCRCENATGLSKVIPKTKRQKNKIFTCLRKIIFNLRILHLTNLSFKCEGRIKIFSHSQEI